MDSTDPLSQLADIHLPADISFWPPAPGWWVVLALLLAAMALLAIYGFRIWRRQRLYQFALAELDKCYSRYHARSTDDPEQDNIRRVDLVNEVNAVLRRVALRHFPQQQVASLSGNAWVEFLRREGAGDTLDDDMGMALAQGRFARRCNVNIDQLYAMAQHWIKHLYLARIEATRTSSTPAPEHA